MAASALLKFSQGLVTGANGQALKGVVGTLVTVANSDNTSVASWQIDLVAADPASAVVPAEPFAFNNNSSTPSATFTPDVPGCYRFVLKVWEVQNRAGNPKSIDIRVFAVPEANGLVAPPPQLWPLPLPDPRSGEATAKPNEMNFDGQERGWCGNGQDDGLLNDALRRIGTAGETAKVARTNFGVNLIFLGATLTCDEVQGTVTLVSDATIFAPSPQEQDGHLINDVPARGGVYRVVSVNAGVATVARLAPWDLAAGLETLTLVSADQGPQLGVWQHTTSGTIVVDTTALSWRNVTPVIPLDRGVALATGPFAEVDSPKELAQITLPTDVAVTTQDYVFHGIVQGEPGLPEGGNTACSVGVRLEYSFDGGSNWTIFAETTYVVPADLVGQQVAIAISVGSILTFAPNVPATIVRLVGIFYPEVVGPDDFNVLGGYLSATANT